MTEFAVTLESDDSDSDRDEIVRHLVAFNDEKASPENFRRLVPSVRDKQGAIVGGLVGNTHWGWLHVTQLWVAERLRGEGLGTKLMRAAEIEAISGGCRRAYLDTFDFQALPFYEKLGYEVFGTLQDFPDGHTRYFLQKRTLGQGDCDDLP